MKQYILGAAFMLLTLSLALNVFLVGKASSCVLIANGADNAAIKSLPLKAVK